MIRLVRLPHAALPAAFLCAFLVSCTSPAPPPRSAGTASQPATQAPAPSATPAFNPSSVTSEIKKATFTDVRGFVEELNQIIRRQDYDAWLTHLTQEYIAYYSDPATLLQISQYPVIKNKGVTLSTLKDFFLQVVYPAHQNDKVDDIDFVGENLVKAITVSPKGDRNILYVLEKHGDTWKIGIGR